MCKESVNKKAIYSSCYHRGIAGLKSVGTQPPQLNTLLSGNFGLEPQRSSTMWSYSNKGEKQLKVAPTGRSLSLCMFVQ